jgi:CubicO group peptidase (beta-lactamase class C family)
MRSPLHSVIALALACSTAQAPRPTASADAPTQGQGPSIHMAALQGDTEAVRRAIAAGADLNQRDAYGSTPLLVAATFGRIEVARALIAAGADLRLKDRQGSTPLHVAAFLGHPELVRAMVDAGADRYATNDSGRTARDLALVPFEDLRATYETLGRALAPVGLKLDLAQIERTRPRIAALLAPRPEELAAVDYTPRPGGGWEVAAPAAQGLDPAQVADLYLHAGHVPTLYGLLVVKDGKLVAEQYYHLGSVDQVSSRMSATKSVVSALVGIALQRGCLSGVDQRMIGFFPTIGDRIRDPRKEQVTVQELLQMRAGYPWEGRTPPYFERLFMRGDREWIPHIADFPLTSPPGTSFAYSNLTSHILGMIVARACDTDLETLAQRRLFGPMGAKVDRWMTDPNGYNWGCSELELTARDMAKLGLLYLDGGRFRGERILPASWVHDSLRRYSEGINFTGPTGTSRLGGYMRDLGYGYQWWSAWAGPHRLDFAWGHGGQLVVLLHDLDMVIVTTADPLHQLPEELGWPFESKVVDLVGRFVASLPEDSLDTPAGR